MQGERLLRLGVGAARKQQRLEAALAGRERDEQLQAGLAAAVADAQLLGSLQLAGVDCDWAEVVASRVGDAGSPALTGLRRTAGLVDPRAPLDVSALMAWHGALLNAPARFRQGPGPRPAGPPTAPPELIAGRLELLVAWLQADSSAALEPSRLGALALARLVEIAPFEDGNGRVARLAAAHLIVRAGGRPPILVGADRGRLEQCLQAAFRLQTEPLVALLDEASERALDVMLQVLEGRG